MGQTVINFIKFFENKIKMLTLSCLIQLNFNKSKTKSLTFRYLRYIYKSK